MLPNISVQPATASRIIVSPGSSCRNVQQREGILKAQFVWLQTEDCVEAHTNVDVVVNIAELRTLLETCLPHVFAGASVESASLPWPPPN